MVTTPALPPKIANWAVGALLTLVMASMGSWIQSNAKTLDTHTLKIELQQAEIQALRERIAVQEAHYADILRHLESIEQAVKKIP